MDASTQEQNERLEIRIVRLEERAIGAATALDLAKQSNSTALEIATKVVDLAKETTAKEYKAMDLRIRGIELAQAKYAILIVILNALIVSAVVKFLGH